MKIYRVGGAVRDQLLGLATQDQDWVVVGGTASELEALGYKPVGRDFPVFLHPQTGEEYALARTERKKGHGYTGFETWTGPEVTLEDDLRRRDLTINAMAEGEDGNIIDPFGGRADLAQRVLRHVSPAFVEDPLRVLRVARFAARLDFRIADETLALMRDIGASGELQHLVPERVWQETERALAEPDAARFFEVLRSCAALDIIFPEIAALFGVPQPEQYHPEIDSGVHTLMVLRQACLLSTDAEVRFAALTHDLGKGTTPKTEWPSHHGHEARGVELIEALCVRLRVPKRFRDLAVLVARYHLDCHRAAELRPGTMLDRLEAVDAFRRPQRLDQFLLACEADARGRSGREDQPYPQAALWKKALAAARQVDASSVTKENLSGEQIGATIRTLRAKAIRKSLNARD